MGLPSISSGQSIVDESALRHTLGIVAAGADTTVCIAVDDTAARMRVRQSLQQQL